MLNQHNRKRKALLGSQSLSKGLSKTKEGLGLKLIQRKRLRMTIKSSPTQNKTIKILTNFLATLINNQFSQNTK
jgi:hypothetical protein